MRNSALGLLTVIAFILANSSSAVACSCDIPYGKTTRQWIKDEFRQSDAVFSGTVIQVVEAKTSEGKSAGYVEVRFRVEKSWKGVPTDEAIIFTTNVCCICGYTFKAGQSYLVYAYGGEKDKYQLWTNICTRTAKLADAAEDLKVLGRGKVVRRAKAASLRQAKPNNGMRPTPRHGASHDN